MRNYLSKILSSLSITNSRCKQIAKHVGWSFVYKTGIWLTLSSFIKLFSFFDNGLGDGLRNKFTEAKTTRRYNKAQSLALTLIKDEILTYVKTAFHTPLCVKLNRTTVQVITTKNQIK